MEETQDHNQLQPHQQQHQQQHQQYAASSFGLKNMGGEIVEVQGGHIVRSIGRKDRHSKVCTAKGPRDRRVRLSAHTAIQFYDVQDRLGYDRPSKAVDWLIKKAQAAINELEELPAWKPSSSNPNQGEETQNHNQLGLENSNNNQSDNSSSFLPPSMDSDSIADTIKSFFPMGASPEGNTSTIQYQSYPQSELLSRASSQSQDLRLSLQSFQDPMFNHHQQQNQHHQNPNPNTTHQTIFSGTPIGFDGSGGSGPGSGSGSGSGWLESQGPELSGFQRMFAWNTGGDTGTGGGGGGLMFNSSPPPQFLFGQNQLFSQRGPLQSSNTPSVRAWIDPADHHHHQQQQQQQQLHQSLPPFYQSQMAGAGYMSGTGFTGFRVPARIQGEQEEHDGISDKPSSGSSDSRR